jgi:ankyrin repeat protein
MEKKLSSSKPTTKQLEHAINEYKLDEIKRLIKEGVDVNANYNNGIPPIATAVIHGYKEIAEMLVDAGANIDVPTYYHGPYAREEYQGNTPLMLAYYQPDMTQFLIDRGADITIKNREGKTALSILSIHDHRERKVRKIIIKKMLELENEKWEKLLEENKIDEFDNLVYEDEEIQDAYRKFKAKVSTANADKFLKHKHIYPNTTDAFDLADALRKQFQGYDSEDEGAGKKRKKTIQKKKKGKNKKQKKTNKRM